MQNTSVKVFRNASWGMSPERVRATETAEFVMDADGALIYEAALVGFDCTVHYTFNDDGELCRGAYFFDHPDDALDAVTFVRLQELLDKKYGPGDFQEHWKSFRRAPIETVSDLGHAVAAGLLGVSVTWSTPHADILLILGDSDTYEAHVVLAYSDPDRPEIGDTTAADYDMI